MYATGFLVLRFRATVGFTEKMNELQDQWGDVVAALRVNANRFASHVALSAIYAFSCELNYPRGDELLCRITNKIAGNRF